MSKFEPYKIFPKLSRQQSECLLKVMQNESKRWDNLISFHRSAAGNSSIAADYEYDFIELNDLIDELKISMSNSMIFEELSFDQTESALIIEALDHEFDLHQGKKSVFSFEEFKLINEIRDKVKEVAVKEYGDEFLKLSHYQRGGNDNRE